MGERVRSKEKELENAGKALQLSIELQGKLGKANEGLRLTEGKLEEVEKQLREKAAEIRKFTLENKEKGEEIIKLQTEIAKLDTEISNLTNKLQAETANNVNLQAEIAAKLSYFLPRDISRLQTQLKDLNQSSTQSNNQLEQAISLLNTEKTDLSESVSTLTQSLVQKEALCLSLRE